MSYLLKNAFLFSFILIGTIYANATIADVKKQSTKLKTRTEQQSTQQLAELQDQIKQLQNNLRNIDQSKNSQINQLKTTDLEINQLVRQIYQLDQKIVKLNSNYNKLNQDIKLNQKKLEQHQQILAGQLNASYYVGQQEFIKLLLNQQNPAVFGRVMTYYQYFNRERSQQIGQVSKIISQLDQQRKQLSLLQQEIELQQYLKTGEKSSLEAQQVKRNELISHLSQEYKNAATKIQQLVKNEQQLKDLLSKLQQVAIKMAKVKAEKARQQQQQEKKSREKKLKLRKPFAKLKRKLKWPLKGKRKKLFGHWRSVGKVKWQGDIIHSQEGKNVYSISHGTVIYSDWLRGYGLLTIIDHGQGYMSLYGYSQAVLKSVGDEVERGEVIATAGRTSGRSKAGIYFEIRYNGKPTNPSRWCRKMPRA